MSRVFRTPPIPSRALRRAFIIASGVCLGLLTSLSIAWGLAILRPPYDSRSLRVIVGWRFDEHGGHVGVLIDQCTGTSLVRSERSPPGLVFGNLPRPGYPTPEEVVPAWARTRVLQWFEPIPGRLPPAAPQYRDVIAHGWPMPCLWLESGVWPSPTRTPPTYTGALRYPARPAPGDTPIYLPYRPLWPGLLINTALAAGVWWLILTVTPILITRLRIPPGHCRNCRYDLRGLATATCPECGKPAPPCAPAPASHAAS